MTRQTAAKVAISEQSYSYFGIFSPLFVYSERSSGFAQRRTGQENFDSHLTIDNSTARKGD